MQPRYKKLRLIVRIHLVGMQKISLLLVLLLIVTGALFAQDGDDIETVASSIVRVNVGVVDHRGRPIMRKCERLLSSSR